MKESLESFVRNSSSKRLVERSEDLAQTRELYNKIAALEASVGTLQQEVFKTDTLNTTLASTMSNLVDNSDFNLSHRAYSLATYQAAEAILAKWYCKSQSSVINYGPNTIASESIHSIRGDFAGNTLYNSYSILSNSQTWQEQNVVQGDPVTEFPIWPINSSLSLSGFGTDDSKIYYVKASTSLLNGGANLFELGTSPTNPTVSLSFNSNNWPPFAIAGLLARAVAQVPVKQDVYWDMMKGYLKCSGGYTIASPLTSRYILLANKLYFKMQLAFAPEKFQVKVDAAGNKLIPQRQLINFFNITTADTKHELLKNTMVKVRSSISLPAPLLADKFYYVASTDENFIQLSETENGAVIDLTTVGDGNIQLIPQIKDNLRCRISLWDNNNGRVFFGEKPKLTLSKVGTHTPRITGNYTRQDYGWFGIGLGIYSSGGSWSLYEASSPSDGATVTVEPDDPANSAFVADRLYKFVGLGTYGPGTGHATWQITELDGTLVNTVAGQDEIMVYQIQSTFEDLVDRYYILEAVMPDGRSFCTDTRVFVEGENKISGTLPVDRTEPDDYVFVNWERIVGASRYNLYRSTNGERGPFYLVSTVAATSTEALDSGGSGSAVFDLEKFDTAKSEVQVAEAIVKNATSTIFNSEDKFVELSAAIQFPSIINNFDQTGEQYLQIEFIKDSDTYTPTDLTDIPRKCLAINKVALSYSFGRWVQSARDQSIVGERTIPSAPPAVGDDLAGVTEVPVAGGGSVSGGDPTNQCVHEDTPILVWADAGDHYWLKAKEIVMGDKLVAWDGEKLVPSKVQKITNGLSRMNYRLLAGDNELVCSFSHKVIADMDDFPKGTNVGKLDKTAVIYKEGAPHTVAIDGLESIESLMRVITFKLEKGKENYVSAGIFSHNRKDEYN